MKPAAMIITVSALLTFCSIPPACDIIYVDASATGMNNGSSWKNAYKYLQNALAAAEYDTDIWVAQGIYRPDEDTLHPAGTNDRSATFRLKYRVAIYGGFPAGGGLWERRDPRKYETILSGDIGVEGNNDDNSYRVVTCSETDSSTILDGFTIANGSNPSGTGAGMRNFICEAIINNCIFRDNSSTAGNGGGMWNSSSNLTITNCVFSNNSAGGGGGMCNAQSSPTVTNCTFSNNSASVLGGGMSSEDNSSPILTNCTFNGNSTSGNGGGMYSDNSNPTLTNCTFSGNSAPYNDGGGIYSDYSSNQTLTNCTFSGNSASNHGGGIANFSSNSTLANCILWGNTAPNGSQIYNSSGTTTVSFSDVQGGYSGTGNINANPLFVDADGPDNTPGTEDDNLRLLPNSPCVDTANNSAVPTGIETDLDGRDRFVDGDCNTTVIVDMGAFEFTHAYFGDFDSDCDVDFIDFAIQAQLWLTDQLLSDIAPTPAGDGLVDTSDLAVLCDNWLETF